MEGEPLQTYLPYDDFNDTAACLDNIRLDKQRHDTLDILQNLLGVRVGNTTKQVNTGNFRIAYFDDDGREVDWVYGEEVPYHAENVPVYETVLTDQKYWSLHVNEPGNIHHPAVEMWRGHEWLLLTYQKEICQEVVRRWGHDTYFAKSMHLFLPYMTTEKAHTTHMPEWLGDERLHKSHQSALLRKMPAHYHSQFRGVPNDIPMFWPTEGGYDGV